MGVDEAKEKIWLMQKNKENIIENAYEFCLGSIHSM